MKGFQSLASEIDEFLATAFFDWIRGKSGVQVQLPKEWNAAGIFSLFTQLLNLSTETIWQRMEVVYDTSVANAFRKGEVVLEKGLEIFDIVKREGLGGLWDHIVELLGTLLSDTLDEMKETVLYAAIKKVFVEIGKMLIPGGGFIAIAEKIIRLVVFIVEAGNKILDLIRGLYFIHGERCQRRHCRNCRPCHYCSDEVHNGGSRFPGRLLWPVGSQRKG